MFLDASAPLPLEVGDPTWYLAWDLAGTWFGAIGTLFAAAVAMWLGLRAIQDQNAQRDEQVRAQANRVILLRRHHGGRHSLTLRNDSDLPISDVRVLSVGALESELVFRDHLGPGQAPDYLQGLSANGSAAVEFVDALGNAWVRTPGGNPLRLRRGESGRNSLHAVIEDSGYGRAVTGLLLRWQNRDGTNIDLPLEGGMMVVGSPRIPWWGRLESAVVRFLNQLIWQILR